MRGLQTNLVRPKSNSNSRRHQNSERTKRTRPIKPLANSGSNWIGCLGRRTKLPPLGSCSDGCLWDRRFFSCFFWGGASSPMHMIARSANLKVYAIVDRNHDNWHQRIDQRDRPMLHFGSRAWASKTTPHPASAVATFSICPLLSPPSRSDGAYRLFRSSSR